MDIDLQQLTDLIDALQDDADVIDKIGGDSFFKGELAELVELEVQGTFESGGAGFSWPAGVTGIETGALMESWTVGGIEVTVEGDTLIFTTSEHDDYGHLFDERYGLLDPSNSFIGEVSDLANSWVQDNTSLDWS